MLAQMQQLRSQGHQLLPEERKQQATALILQLAQSMGLGRDSDESEGDHDSS